MPELRRTDCTRASPSPPSVGTDAEADVARREFCVRIPPAEVLSFGLPRILSQLTNWRQPTTAVVVSDTRERPSEEFSRVTHVLTLDVIEGVVCFESHPNEFILTARSI